MDEIFENSEKKMKKAVELLKQDLSTVRAGRANPSLLDNVTVNYYNTNLPINQVATITAPESRLLVIQPWDKSIVGDIEKAILKSDLGLTPNNDGNVIRLNIPQLTEERRKELVKKVRKKAEDTKVAVRNVRREAKDQIKNEEKQGNLSEDDSKKGQEKIQELTDNAISEVDKLLEQKEKEIMEV